MKLNKLPLLGITFICTIFVASSAYAGFSTYSNDDSQSLSSRRPHGIGFHSNDKTFYCWSGAGSGSNSMNIKLRTYYHNTDWYGSVKTLPGSGIPNHHNYPVMIRASDGRILIFFADHDNNLFMYRSTQADSIWNWEPLVQIGNHDASYPMPILSDNGDIYLFFRRAVDGESTTSVRSLGYVKSSNDGSTWSYFNNVIDNSAGNLNNDEYKWLTTIYNAKIVHESADAIYPERLLISWILAGRNSDGSGYYDSVHRNVYFAFLNLDDQKMYSANQANCGSIVDYNDHVNRCLVFDSGNPNNNEHRIDYVTIPSYNRNTYNHLVAFESQHSSSYALGINIAIQNGANWTPINVGQYNAINDLERWSDNRFRIYLKQSDGNVRPVKTLDGWQTWFTEDEIAAPYEVANIQLISNPTSTFKGLIKTYDGYPWANADYTSGYHNYTFGF